MARCELATRHGVGETDAVSCASPVARTNCATLSALLIPRVATDVAHAALPLPDRLQTQVGIGRDLRMLGDSHNPDDPYFSAFRQKVLDHYGVLHARQPVDALRIVGLLLVVAGAVLVVKPWQASGG